MTSLISEFESIPQVGLDPLWISEYQRSECDPEIKLMIAVLEDGIDTACSAHHLCLEARAWVEDSEENYTFSFINICETVGLNVGRVRVELMGRAGWQLAPVPSPRYHYKRRARRPVKTLVAA